MDATKNYLFVRDIGDDDNGLLAGAVYVFSYKDGNWVDQTKLVTDDGQPEHRFGISVSLTDNYALIGANDGSYDNPRGAVYIFERKKDSWTQSEKLVADKQSYPNSFGFSVSIAKNFAIVSAIYYDAYSLTPGEAYLYRRSQQYEKAWIKATKLSAEDGFAGDCFGLSVAISDNHAIVGDWRAEPAGAAYIYELTGCRVDRLGFAGCSP